MVRNDGIDSGEWNVYLMRLIGRRQCRNSGQLRLLLLKLLLLVLQLLLLLLQLGHGHLDAWRHGWTTDEDCTCTSCCRFCKSRDTYRLRLKPQLVRAQRCILLQRQQLHQTLVLRQQPLWIHV